MHFWIIHFYQYLNQYVISTVCMYVLKQCILFVTESVCFPIAVPKHRYNIWRIVCVYVLCYAMLYLIIYSFLNVLSEYEVWFSTYLEQHDICVDIISPALDFLHFISLLLWWKSMISCVLVNTEYINRALQYIFFILVEEILMGKCMSNTKL
jgi:hypothetical protein